MTSLGESAEAALSGGKITEGFEEVVPTEFGPALRSDPYLGVTDLPEQEIADPHLAGSADQQVGIAHAGGVEVRGDGLLVDVVRIQ